MRYRDTLEYSSQPNREWKYIKIDYQFGHTIRLHGDDVGGFLIRPSTWGDGIKVFMIEGIEIEPEFRNKGIARAVVRMFMEQCDIVVGSITEDDCKPFWKKMGAKFCELPLESFAEELLPSITTKEPLFFYITKNPKAKEFAEKIAKEIPELLKKQSIV